ncbi:branched-chain amino acid ABC transporter permease [Aerococcaceae bacterium WS4759]|uniref:Branched-chain amino acid ABC transporter permease n=1 Tax=Fundicoccus ignavus TaxID=2664442 RepID=A0A6I2GKB8_9LACT|nr:AzlC family ABC transporter permease [Fundicoccus ignavus]MRI86292.1 branched-chain amino acid ABC transporter permease [Fundicoccus ignavus]
MKNALKYSFPLTIPIMAGYVFLGISFGILATSKGLPLYYPVLMGVVIYGGSMQFAAVNLLLAAFNPIGAILLTIMVHARHIFYGITMLVPFNQLKNGFRKIYCMFGLTDETFSLLASLEVPEEQDRNWVYFLITFLNQCYWVIGCGLGAVIGSNLTFNTEGIEFVLTALFVTIFVEQWLNASSHRPAIIGLVGSAVCLVIFGGANFMIPAMIIILILFSLDYYKEVKQGHE